MCVEIMGIYPTFWANVYKIGVSRLVEMVLLILS